MTTRSHITIAAVLALAAVSSAGAQESSRADVQAELAAARASGAQLAMHGEDSGSAFLSSRMTAQTLATREDVAAQRRQASDLDLGLHGEDSGSFAMSRQPVQTVVTREQVSAELARDREAMQALHGEDSGSFYLARHPSLPATVLLAGRR